MFYLPYIKQAELFIHTQTLPSVGGSQDQPFLFWQFVFELKERQMENLKEQSQGNNLIGELKKYDVNIQISGA